MINVIRQLLIGIWSALCLALSATACVMTELAFRDMNSSMLEAPFEYTGQAWFLAVAAISALIAFFWSKALWGVAIGVMAAFVHAMVYSRQPQSAVILSFMPVFVVPVISIALAMWQAKSDEPKDASPEEVFA
ncbi:MAG: hypothetical protein CMK09_13575 [Ponticaulis sp.]|nr:hypothetical protein [Ponticaulis sp.]